MKRWECTSPELRAAAKAAKDLSDNAGEAFAKGLFPELLSLAPDPAISETAEVKWWNKLEDGLLTGTLFFVGSGAHPRWGRLSAFPCSPCAEYVRLCVKCDRRL